MLSPQPTPGELKARLGAVIDLDRLADRTTLHPLWTVRPNDHHHFAAQATTTENRSAKAGPKHRR
jgi:hypothetical protein